jgi:YD repeat-containing protein
MNASHTTRAWKQNQLTKVVLGANTTASYSYDPVGNRLSSLISQYFSNNSNQLTAAGANTYSYDDNGNMLSKTTAAGTSAYTWDFENRMISATVPGQNHQGQWYRNSVRC